MDTFVHMARDESHTLASTTISTYMHGCLRYASLVYGVEQRPASLVLARRRMAAWSPKLPDHRLPLRVEEGRWVRDRFLEKGELGAATACALLWDLAARGGDLLEQPTSSGVPQPTPVSAVTSWLASERGPQDAHPAFACILTTPKLSAPQARTLRREGSDQHPDSLGGLFLLLKILERPRRPMEPLFTWSSGSAIRLEALRKAVRSFLPEWMKPRVGLHSWRIGSISHLVVVREWSEVDACAFARWKSLDSARRYIRAGGLVRPEPSRRVEDGRGVASPAASETADTTSP